MIASRTGKRIFLKASIVAMIAIFGSVTVLESAYADPPPWAPAWGYRAKHKGKNKGKWKHKQPQYAYAVPYGIDLGRCNRDILGGVLGGATGAAAGSTIGSGDGKTAAIIGGAILGVLVGGAIGSYMDDVDQNCIGQALEHAGDGETINWNSGGNQYAVTPVSTQQISDNSYCREYTTTGVIGGKAESLYGRACRQPDGSCQFVN